MDILRYITFRYCDEVKLLILALALLVVCAAVRVASETVRRWVRGR